MRDRRPLARVFVASSPRLGKPLGTPDLGTAKATDMNLSQTKSLSRLTLSLLLVCAGVAPWGSSPQGSSPQPSPAANPPVPTNFRVEAIDNRDRARLTWSSGTSHVRIFIQKKLPNGTWEPVSGFPKNQENTGRFVYDTPATTVGTFKFWIRALDRATSSYSLPTEEIIRRDMH